MKTRPRSRRPLHRISLSEQLEARTLLSAVIFSPPVNVVASTSVSQSFADPSVVDLGNGHSDIVALDTANSAIDVFLGKGDGTFSPPQVLDAGHVTSGLLATDLGNGHIDLIAQNASAGTIDVLLGNGNATFQAPVTYDAGKGQFHLADLGNGHPDLIVPVTTGINILLGNSNGTFSTGTTLATPSEAYASIQIADLGNGHPDLVYYTNSPKALNIAIGKGDGTFATPQVIPETVAITSIRIADLGNGHPDLVLSNYNRSAAVTSDRFTSVMLGNGDGTFKAATNLPIAASVYLVDLGNGHPDLVYTGTNAIEVQVGNGDGTFQSPVTYAIGFAPTGIEVGDLGTGHLDIFVYDLSTSTGAKAVALIGNGDGTFESGHTFPAPLDQVLYSIVTIDGKNAVLFGASGTLDYMTALPGSGNQLAFTPEPSSTTTDTSFTTFSVQVLNPHGAVITTASPTITLEANLSTGAISGVTTVQAVNGVATFSGIAITTVGAYTLSASDGSDYPAVGVLVNVYAAQPLGAFTTAADLAKIRADTAALAAVHARTAAYRATFYASTTGQTDLTNVSGDQTLLQGTIADTRMSINGGPYNPEDPEDSPAATKYDVAASRLQVASDQLQLHADLSQAVTSLIATNAAAAAQLLAHDKNQLAFDTARIAASTKSRLTSTVTADLTAVYQAAQIFTLDQLNGSDQLITDQATNLNNSADDQENLMQVHQGIFEDLSTTDGGTGVVTAADLAALATAKADIQTDTAQEKALIATDNATLRQAQTRDAATLKAAKAKLASDLAHHL